MNFSLKATRTYSKAAKIYLTPNPRWAASLFACMVVLFSWGGCAVTPEKLEIYESGSTFKAGAIISTETGLPISFETLIKDLSHVDVIYLGEKHTAVDHHAIQLKIIKNLLLKYPDTVVGMEMFDRTYQPILDRWSAGELDEQDFLEKVHWYANWKFDFTLYKEILLFVKANHVKLVGLNLPAHLPSKIAVGGIANLSQEDKKHIAEHIDITNTRHREYVEKIFRHHKLRGRENFDYFYAAQCAWEDTMAESIAHYENHDKIIVLAGNGHIIKKFGVPDRAFNRTRKPFKTVYPISAGQKIHLDVADYLWVTE